VEIVQPSFGIRIRHLRLDKGFSQLELADLLGLSEEQIGNIERGKSWVGEQTLALLSEALTVPQGLLFDYSGNEEFIKRGGLKQRAPRKPALLIVRHKRKILVKAPKTQKRRRRDNPS
jgi:transcriptional regulator with XRE-family HTH domain